MANEKYDEAGTINPDFLNFSNILFTKWEELNNSTVNLRLCKNGEFRIYQREFIRCFLSFFGQINDTKKLSHFSHDERTYLLRYYNKPTLISVAASKKINELTRKLMTDYGIFDLEKFSGDDEMW